MVEGGPLLHARSGPLLHAHFQGEVLVGSGVGSVVPRVGGVVEPWGHGRVGQPNRGAGVREPVVVQAGNHPGRAGRPVADYEPAVRQITESSGRQPAARAASFSAGIATRQDEAEGVLAANTTATPPTVAEAKPEQTAEKNH